MNSHMSRKWILFFIVVALVELLLLRLGYWQYNRMHEKDTLKAEFMASLPERTQVLNGVFDHSREVVLESQKYRNLYGYRVLTPLVMGEREIIVDRGWVPRSFEKDFLLGYHAVGTHTVEGVVRDVPKAKQTWFKGSEVGAEGAATVLQLLILDNIPKDPNIQRVEGQYLQATKATAPKIKAFFVEPEGGAKHKEYMLTWWTLAFILPILSLLLWFKRKREDKPVHTQ